LLESPLLKTEKVAQMSETNPSGPKTEPSGPDFSRCGGLLPAIAQDAATGEILMMAYMNAESYAETLATGRAVYFSRSRSKLWRKGEESGNVQLVRAIFVDCDLDTILLRVEQIGGAACHEGYKSCFFRQVTPEGLKVVGQRVFDPATVYGKK
jgi:phosphoribosyl-AMP cyclohydrolase